MMKTVFTAMASTSPPAFRESPFQVTARTSSFAFKNRNEDVRQIGSELGASHILEGSVRKAGARVEEARVQFLRTLDLEPHFRGAVASVFGAAGRTDEARELLAELEERAARRGATPRGHRVHSPRTQLGPPPR